MSFAQLKERKDQIQSLIKAAEQAGGNSEKKSYTDERFWKPTVDKAGNGYAVIRFLPAPKGEELPWIRYWDHGFKGPTGLWYIENSLTSIGQSDPVGELNSRLWNSGVEADKEKARAQKRRLHYVTNVYIVSDPSNPDNEGKVFLYQFGKKIFDKIMDMMQPSFADEKAVNPFDLWEGSNFKLKIRNVEGYRNYDKSEFDSSSALFDGDEAQLEEVYNKLYKLSEFTDPENYKSYSDLKRKLFEVIGEAEVATGLSTEQQVELNTVKEAPVMNSAESEAPVEASNDTTSEGEEGDTLSYFAKLASS